MAKKKNVFRRYFENFGLKQICDILMVISLIVLVVGWILWNTVDIVLTVAFGLFILTSFLSIIRCISIIHREPNKRSPERRAAVVNVIIMLVIFAVAVFALIWGVMVGYSLPATN
ncbi:MAG: hypothetical protein J1F36_01440 [Clostridiales bacterium]|nr:hypothetical protein [Clostridiales bacterium]